MTEADRRPAPPASEPDGELVQRLRGLVADRMAQQAGRDGAMTAAARSRLGRALIREVLEEEAAAALTSGRAPLDQTAEQQAADRIYADLWGLGGFQPYLDDRQVESVSANGCDQVFVQYSGGYRSRVAPVAASDEELTDLIRAIAARGGIEERRFDRSSPRVSVPLPGGGRLFAVQAVTGRPCVAIRRDRLSRAGLRELVRNGTVDEPLAAFLSALVKARKNLLISGGTSVGKTTMLRALASAIPPDERLITIEDSLELCLDWDEAAHPDVVAMQSREPNTEGEGEITLAELVRWALRMTPDRVLVGEVRGAEVIPMLNAMSQGNDGSMTTIHASSSRGAMLKLAAYAAQSPEHLTLEDTGLLIAGAIHFVIQLAWDTGGTRCVCSIREIVDADGRQVVSQRGMGSRPGPPRRPGRPGPRRHHGGTRSRRLPARTVAGGMSAATAGILGALAGLGVLLVIAGLRRTGCARAGPEAAPARGPGPAGGDPAPRRRDRRRGGGRGRRHPVAGRDGAGRAGGLVPAPDAGTGPASTPAPLERIEAIATFTEMLRDTISAAAGLEQAILAAEPVAPASDPRARRAAGRADPPRASGCPRRCARSPPRPPTRPPTSSSPRCCWPPSSRPGTWPSCWAAWPTRPASTR